jgi:hypothetical protein
MKAKTYLPVFPGFYNTNFDVDLCDIESDVTEHKYANF